jgi:hypothetical protein
MTNSIQNFAGEHDPKQKGAIGYILAWAIGIPIPILLIVWLVARGC